MKTYYVYDASIGSTDSQSWQTSVADSRGGGLLAFGRGCEKRCLIDVPVKSIKVKKTCFLCFFLLLNVFWRF